MKLITIILLILFYNTVLSIEVSDTLLKAIAIVESNDSQYEYNEKEGANGRYQIRKIYLDDVNRIYKTNYTVDDLYDTEKSKEVIKLYLEYYGNIYEKNTGKVATDIVLARIHNGGQYGYRKECTKKYGDKVWKQILQMKKEENL